MRRAGVLLTNPNLLRLRFLGLGQRHGQDSILIARADFVRIHPDWERAAPTEFADVTLCAFGFLAVRSLAASLAADRHGLVAQGNFDVSPAHSGQFDDGDDVVVVLAKIERGRPATEELSRASEAQPRG
jgi:hypothetical protein